MDGPLRLFTIAFLSIVILVSLNNLSTAEEVEMVEEKPIEITLADKLVEESVKYRGTNYRPGGMSPKKGFDCSGFTQYVFKKFNIKLRRSAKEQAEQGKAVELSEVMKGDLIFFAGNKSISHVGIVLSNQDEPLTIIHSSSSQGIMITDLEDSKYWKPKIKLAKRYL